MEIFNVMTKDEKSSGKSDIDRKTIKAIAGNAKKMRKEMKVGYEEFALKAGINRNSYYRFERAAKTGENFTIGLLLKVIKGLNVPVSEFFKTIK